MSQTTGAPPRFLYWYTTAISLLGGGVIAYSSYALASTPEPEEWLALGALAVLATRFSLKLPGVSARVSTSDTFFLLLALVYGPAPATVAIAVDSLLMSWSRKHRAQQLFFNPTSAALSLWCGATVYAAWSGALGGTEGLAGADMILPLACMTCVYFVLNSGLTCIAIASAKGLPVFQLWRQHFALMSVNYFAAASASFCLVIVVRHAGLVSALAVLPLIAVCYITMRSYVGRLDDARQHIERVNGLYLSTVGAFATAIEAKDGVTSNHIYRVQAYSLELAGAMGIKDLLALQALEAAALLHDTGKIAIPDHILNKPGRLTPHEYDTMKLHVDAGAHILSSIDFPYPVVPIVRAHHENWDGTGYPNGLRGEEIPLGARILSVVDCFDALTSDRPYRPAMQTKDALQIVLERRGTMYDPAVVDAFVQIRADRVHAEAPRPDVQQALRSISLGSPAPVAASAPLVAADAVQTTVSEELLAFVSLAHLATRQASAVDVARAAWGPIRNVVPNSSMALYTLDHSTNTLRPAFAAGPGATMLRALTMRVGERVSGWAAANQRTMVNAQAGLDLPMAEKVGLSHAVALPLLAGGATVGVVSLYSAEKFRDDQLQRLEQIVPYLAEAVRAVETVPLAEVLRPIAVGKSRPLTSARPGFRLVAPKATEDSPPQPAPWRSEDRLEAAQGG